MKQDRELGQLLVQVYIVNRTCVVQWVYIENELYVVFYKILGDENLPFLSNDIMGLPYDNNIRDCCCGETFLREKHFCCDPGIVKCVGDEKILKIGE